jgi:hypothetical protein
LGEKPSRYAMKSSRRRCGAPLADYDREDKKIPPVKKVA